MMVRIKSMTDPCILLARHLRASVSSNEKWKILSRAAQSPILGKWPSCSSLYSTLLRTLISCNLASLHPKGQVLPSKGHVRSPG